MKKLLILFSLFFLSLTATAQQQPTDWQTVEKVFGQKGTTQDDVFKMTFPRSDLRVKVGEVSIEPGLALTSWIAFSQMGSQTMIMGDLVLLDKEVDPVMSMLISNGIEVTSLHNHLVNESASIMYMHFSGKGDPKKLAGTMKSALELTDTPLTSPSPQKSPATTNRTKVESILGWTGKHKGNLLSIAVPRAEAITENGMEIPSSMGVATAINFQKVGDKAATTGDFVLTANEVNPVIKSLTEHGITVTAIHNHMLFETPRLFFLHFWGFDDLEKLANGLRAALDKTNSLKKK